MVVGDVVVGGCVADVHAIRRPPSNHCILRWATAMLSEWTVLERIHVPWPKAIPDVTFCRHLDSAYLQPSTRLCSMQSAIKPASSLKLARGLARYQYQSY